MLSDINILGISASVTDSLRTMVLKVFKALEIPKLAVDVLDIRSLAKKDSFVIVDRQRPSVADGSLLSFMVTYIAKHSWPYNLLKHIFDIYLTYIWTSQKYMFVAKSCVCRIYILFLWGLLQGPMYGPLTAILIELGYLRSWSKYDKNVINLLYYMIHIIKMKNNRINDIPVNIVGKNRKKILAYWYFANPSGIKWGTFRKKN